MNRWLLLVGIAFVWACSCAPPPPEPLHGRPAFDAWIVNNGIREENANLGGYPGAPCGGYLAAQKLALVDDACIARASAAAGIDDELTARYTTWVHFHELGHAVDIALAFPQGGNLVGFERGAQCVAEVVLGWSLQPPNGDTAGYWDCPDGQVDRTRILMEAIGAF